MGQFNHLHVYSEYSLLTGASRVEELARRAKELGMDSLALTDQNVMYGVIPFYKACKANGIKPIIGMEINIFNGDLGDRPKREDYRLYTLVLLAENFQGYQNLMKLSSIAQLEGFYEKPRINKEILRTYSDGLIALSGCLKGEVPSLLLQNKGTEAVMAALEYQDIFGENHFFLELQDHDLLEQKNVNQHLVQLSQNTNIPLVVTNHVHYIDRQDGKTQDVLLCIGTGHKLKETDRPRLRTEEYYLKSAPEMIERFKWARTALDNTVKIAARCHVDISFHQAILPYFELPSGYTSETYLHELCLKGAKDRYGDELRDEHLERMNYELHIINSMGFADYFLIVWDFMNYAHRQGIPTGPGRGSAAGSLVAYVLRITNVDPIEHQLLFERFLNPERISMPDIDIDFAFERRDEVIRYVIDKYGQDRVAQIITFGTMAAKGAVRDVGRVLDYPYAVVDRIAKAIPGSLNMTVQRALEESPELKEMADSNDEVRQLLRIAQSIEGLPRHASTHAAGIVISKEPLTTYVPLQQGTDEGAQTQYAMEILEELGLLKMDFLGLRNLSIIEGALQDIKVMTGTAIHLDTLPKDDPKTFSMLAKGDTTGIFQLESTGMRNVLRELRPNRFDDIVAVLALYRPGPMENIPVYIKAKHGELPTHYPHPSLTAILKDTYGVIIYQEQIMQIAATMGGYSLGEADILRRGVSKKQKEVLDAERERFVQGALQKGYDLAVAEEVYDLIVRFANYGFNKSHSVAYGVIAYQMAYLKANYPVPFMNALLASVRGSHNKVAEYIEEARRMEIPIYPPNINQSYIDFTVEGEGIRVGLIVIKNVGIQAINAIIEERARGGNYKDYYDFIKRVDTRVVNRRVIESLIQGGALDVLEGHRAEKLAFLGELLEWAGDSKKKTDRNQLELFDEEDDHFYSKPQFPKVEPYSHKEILAMEREVIGLYLSGHPLDEYRALLEHPKVTPIRLLNEPGEVTDQQIVRIGGMLSRLRAITTRKGDPMAFATIEDKTASIEVVLFPKVFGPLRFILKEEALFMIEGKVSIQEEEVKLIGERIWKLEDLIARVAKKSSEDAVQEMTPVSQDTHVASGTNEIHGKRSVYIKITKAHIVTNKVAKLEEILLQHPGEHPVFLYYTEQKVTKQLSVKYNTSTSLDFIKKVRNLLGANSIVVKEG